MLLLILYYLVLPFVLAALVVRLIRRYGADPVPEGVRRAVAADPPEPKTFRVLEVEGGVESRDARLTKIGDFDAQDKAVDAAYRRRGEEPKPGLAWLVLNDRGDILQEVD
ncbi:MAG: hypothetical protein HY554_01530 [Elusimicrobia bacterium]|nr:hypothetical protein [Elusimicrobiota bacterium]